MRWLVFCGTLMLLTPSAWAETATIEVQHLGLDEAAEVARTQLSASGRAVPIPSRRLLLIEDDAAHVDKVRSLLSRLDLPPPRYQVTVEMRYRRLRKEELVAGVSRLPGGWLKLANASLEQSLIADRRFQLKMLARRSVHMELGEIRLSRQAISHRLPTLEPGDQVTQVPVTAGFDLLLRPVADGKIQAQIHPWLKRLNHHSDIHGEQELLLDLGSPAHPAAPPQQPADSPLRYNIHPQIQPQNQRIEMAEADTQLLLAPGIWTEVAAFEAGAAEFGTLLLSSRSSVGKQWLVIRLKAESVR